LIAKFRLLEEKLILSLGGRYDIFKIDLEDTGRHTDKNHFSPSIGIAYLPIENLKIRAHYTKGFALPTDSQLGANFIYSYYGTNYHYIGNENLEPESSDSYEVGIDVFNNFADFEITYFWNKTRNFISPFLYLIDGSDRYYTYINNDIAYRSGVEIAAAIDIGGLLDQNFVLKPSLSLTHFFTFKTRATPTARFNPITGIPENAIAVNLFFKHPESDFMANLSISRFTNQINNINGTHMSYTTADLVVQKRLVDFDQFGKLSARVSINNLTNQFFRTNTTAGYNMAGRRIYGGLIYEY
jgi:vitamin B12 transporter